MSKNDKRRRALDQISELNGAIGTGLTMEGTLRGKGNYKVAGRVVGECDIEGAILLDQLGTWNGKIVADVVVIAGQVEGEVIARKQLELQSTAVVHGSLQSPEIAMDKGAKHVGELKMTGKNEINSFSEKRN